MASTAAFEIAFDRILPKELFERAGDSKDRKTRKRKLPPQVVARTLVGMGLFRDRSVPAVLDRLPGLGGSVSWGISERPHASSITEARDRLGFEPVRQLFQEHASLQLSLHGNPDAWRDFDAVYAMDGSTLRTADTAANEHEFGRPGTSRGKSAFPQLRIVTLAGIRTHLIADAVLGPYCTNELKLAEHLVGRLRPKTLLILDRAYHSYFWGALLHQAKAGFLVRAKAEGFSVSTPRKFEVLGPKDWLAKLKIPDSTRQRHPNLPEELVVRVITRGRRGRKITLITSLLSPENYPADEVVRLYEARWEAELTYRELKTRLAGSNLPLRSKRPRRVVQEAYGLLTAYNCVRGVMCAAADLCDLSPLRLSFASALEHVRATVTANSAYDELVSAISTCVLPPRRVRSYLRAVKRRPSKFPVKRPGAKTAPLTRRQHQRRGVEEKRRRAAEEKSRLRETVQGMALAC